MELRLVCLQVRDLDSMTAFYNDVLETEPDRVEEGRLIEYEFDGVLFGLYDPTYDAAGATIAYGDNCVPAFKAGDDFDRQRRRIEEIATVLCERVAEGHRWLVFKDPEGNHVEIYE